MGNEKWCLGCGEIHEVAFLGNVYVCSKNGVIVDENVILQNDYSESNDQESKTEISLNNLGADGLAMLYNFC